MDAKTLFDELVPQALIDYPEKAKDIKGRFQVRITGKDGGEWFLDGASGTCRPGTGEADSTLSCSVDDFNKLVADPIKNALPMLVSRAVRIEGKQMLAMSTATKLIEIAKTAKAAKK
jgi:putative sterol carrier protein